MSDRDELELSSYQEAILHGFGGPGGPKDNRTPKHVYQFTVPIGVIAQRREKNRAARRARRLNRSRR